MPSTAGGATIGALGGAGTGAAIGSAIAPGVGTLIGGGIGLLVGAFSGAKTTRETNAALAGIEDIPATSPLQAGFLNELRKERRLIEAGLTPEFAVGRQLIQQAGTNAIDAVTSISGMTPAFQLQALRTIGQNTSKGINQLIGTISTQRGQYLDRIGQMIGAISQRKLDVETFKRVQDLGVAMQNQADFNQNMMASAMMGLGNFSDLSNINLGSIGGGPGFLANRSFGTEAARGMVGPTGQSFNVATNPGFRSPLKQLPPMTPPGS